MERYDVQLVPQLPATVDPNTITMSPNPQAKDSRRFKDIARVKLGQIGLK